MNTKATLIFGILAAMAGLSSCADESNLLRQETVRLTIRAEAEAEPDSKATLDNSYSFIWETGDAIGVSISNASTPTTNAPGTASVNGDVATYSAEVNDYAAGDVLYAYYPYAAGAERDGGKVKLSISAAQTQKTAGVLNGDNFPMLASPYTFVSDASAAEEPSLYFRHLAAFVEFDIYASEDSFVGEKIQSVEFETSSTIAGAFQIELASDDLEYAIVTEGSSKSVTTTLMTPAAVTSSKGVNRIYMAVAPGTYQASVRVRTDAGVYLFQIADEIGEFERAHVRRFSLGLKAEKQISKSTLTEYTSMYMGTQTNETRGVYFDLEAASNYGKAGAAETGDRKKTDLVLFYSSSNGFCLAAPACTDLSNFVSGGVIDCYGWSTEEKNKTKIKLLEGFTAEQYAGLNASLIESLTEGWENTGDASYHKQTGIAKDTYYGFKTVQMSSDGSIKEVVSAGVMKITGVNNSSEATRCVKFDYKICQSSSALDSPSVVSVSGGKLYVDGTEYVIKGVAANNFHGSAASVGANTVRVYDMNTNNLADLEYILDEAYMNGLKVCVGLTMFAWNYGGITNYYDEKYATTVEKLRTHVKNVVGAYANHPAVLMWCVGNECDSAYDGTEDLTAEHHMWNVINEFAGDIKEIDTNHPVTTCLAKAANVSYINTYCSNLDLLMVNSYGDAIPGLGASLSDWAKPFVVGEFAHQGTWALSADRKLSWTTTSGNNALIEQTSTQKAADYVTAWNNVLASGAQGGFAFQWGYQKHGEVLTWYGLHDKNGYTFGAVDELQNLWTGSYPSAKAPVIVDRNAMTLNGKTADDGVSLTAAQTCSAAVTATSPSGASLTYDWIIIEEASADTDGSLPDGLQGLIASPSAASISFTAPSTAGAYRLYAFVYDRSARKVASACIPFQVTE